MNLVVDVAEGLKMNKLVVSTFPDQTKIDAAIGALRKIRSDRNIKLYASAVVTKGADRSLSVREITKEGHGSTAAAALIGALAGLAAGPVAAAITATGGAVIGNAADMSAEDDFREFANTLPDRIAPGVMAIVADVAEDGVTAFKASIEGLGGTAIV
jgi:uncharacterized membrane protein